MVSSGREGGEEECAYVVWIKSQPSLKAVSAGISAKVAKERVVGRTLRTACWIRVAVFLVGSPPRSDIYER